MFADLDTARGWLAGIIDGEGSVQHYRQPGIRTYRNVRITNTDIALLDRVEEVLDALGVTYARRDRSERKRLGKKPIFDICITGRANLLIIAELPLVTEKGAKLRAALDSYVRGITCPSRDELAAQVALKSDKEIASDFDVTPAAVWHWRQKLEIPRTRVA